MNCLSLASLLDYLHGHLSEAERADIAAHLAAGCPHCLENQRWLEEIQRLTAQDDSIEFPEPVIASIVAGFKRQARQPLRQLIAQLIFDSLFPQQLAPVRADLAGEAAPVSRQALYRAEGYDIDLRFERTGEADGEDLIGQILAGHTDRAELDGLTVQLLCDNSEASSTRTNARGIFRFTRLPAGACDLKIHVPEGEISIPQLRTTRAS
ncbi:MAG TPA: zf-HC2 domain-containing protein [Blastocatellia bacterium]|nr:zf-HC2 domain-containing protein [Blastocatellia bacterium]